MEFDALIAYDSKNNLSVVNSDTIVAVDSVAPPADQLAQAWLDRFKIPGTGLITEKDGSTIQTLRVKTSHGVEQNVRFMGPLRMNVVMRCDKGAQTDDLMIEDAKLQNDIAVNSDYTTCRDFEVRRGLLRLAKV